MIMEAENNGKVGEKEFVFRKKTGESVSALFAAEIIYINNVKCIFASVNDISERKRGEEALRESNRKINTLINNLKGVVFQCDNDKKWTMNFISEGIFELTGYPADDFVNKRIRSYDSIIDPQDKQEIWTKIQKAVSAEFPIRLNTGFKPPLRTRSGFGNGDAEFSKMVN